MIGEKTQNTNPLSKRIFDIIQDVADTFVLLIRINLELFMNFIDLFFKKKLKDISGEVILITGAGHGIGRELALQYTAHHSTVICVDINEKNNEETVKRAKRISKGIVHGYICDVTNHDAVLQLADRIKNDVGLVSVLVNNAGIMPTNSLDKQTPDSIRQTFEVNVFAHFWTLEAFLPHMKQQNRGHIICLSSMAGMVGLPHLVPYSASKFAVRGLMEALFNELREGPYRDVIKFTSIFPYAVNTGLCEGVKSRFPSMLTMLDPKEVAENIVVAHRGDVENLALPKYMMGLNNWARVMPFKCGLLLLDYLDSGVGYSNKSM